VIKLNSNNVSISYDCYKSVLTDNEELKEEIKHLKEEIVYWIKQHSQEKMDHTTTKARIVFAKKILSGERDERVKVNTNAIEHFNHYGF
jgi:hypothetical protein